MMAKARFCKKGFWKSAYLGMALLPAAVAAVAPAAAQDQTARQANDSGDIIVTAQRREQSVQNVAISMNAFSGAQIKDLGLTNAADVAKIAPNVNFISDYVIGKPSISIRGISIGRLSTNFEQSPVGIYYDDVFIGARSAQLAQIYDLERVEVLRGPQGTLFGRNTTAGAVNFIAKKPGHDFDVDASLTYGRFNEVEFEGGVTIPVSSTLSMRVAGTTRQRDGWIKNVYVNAPPGQKDLNNIDSWAGRAILRWEPADGVRWDLNVHGATSDSRGPALFQDLGLDGHNTPNIYTGYQAPTAWNKVEHNRPDNEWLRNYGASLNGSIAFGDFTLSSITSYEKTRYSYEQDGDGSPVDLTYIITPDQQWQFSQELRLGGKVGAFDFILGAYYYRDKLNQQTQNFIYADPIFAGSGFGTTSSVDMVQNSRNHAFFADVRYALTDQLTIDLGGRYTWETKDIDANSYTTLLDTGVTTQTIGFPGDTGSKRKNRWKAPTWRAALEYKPTTDTLLYASYSRGFKSGGYNGLAIGNSSELTPYQPEKADAYELGFKSTWMDGKLTLNGALFYSKIKDIQSLRVAFDFTGIHFFVENATSGTSRGGELELRYRPDDRLMLSAGLGVLRTKFGTYILGDGTDATGRDFVGAPRVSANATVQYGIPVGDGMLRPSVTATYTSHQWFEPHQRPGIDEQKGYVLLNAHIPYEFPDGHWEISVWGKNLTNKKYYTNTLGNNVSSGAATSYHADPVTYGVTARYKFK